MVDMLLATERERESECVCRRECLQLTAENEERYSDLVADETE